MFRNLQGLTKKKKFSSLILDVSCCSLTSKSDSVLLRAKNYFFTFVELCVFVLYVLFSSDVNTYGTVMI
jgi:hypothetical protein